MRTYHERLTAPAALWVGALAVAVVLGLTVGAALGPVAATAGGVLLAGLSVMVLLRSAAVVEVRDGDLVAGPARIPVRLLGPAEVLDGDRARAVRGPESDPAAFHLIRGWVAEGVRLEVLDPGDRTPYWFVATRRPARLAAAIEDARSPT